MALFYYVLLHCVYIMKWSWWRHQMETFSALLTICVGNSPVTGEFPAQRPVRWSFAVFCLLFLICVCINGWVNNRKAGDLRHYRAHYDVTVIFMRFLWSFSSTFKVIPKSTSQTYQHQTRTKLNKARTMYIPHGMYFVLSYHTFTLLVNGQALHKLCPCVFYGNECSSFFRSLMFGIYDIIVCV